MRVDDWRPRWAYTAGSLVFALTIGGPLDTAQGQPSAAGSALRFYGSNIDNTDKVYIRIDNPEVPADIGATDFTIEFWLKANPGDNTNTGVTAGQNFSWLNGNIVVDRDIYGPPDWGDFGLSLSGCAVTFGLETNSGARTLVGSRNVCDSAWHHIAIQRRSSDGRLWLFVDGSLQSSEDGPNGDASYRNGRSANAVNDPFLVIGGEKHGFDNLQFRGWVDELRISTVLRYGSGDFTRPTAVFIPDALTAALYHFDEGTGVVARDLSGAAGGPSDGQLRVGGNPAGPAWVASDAPLGGGGPMPPAAPTNLRIIK